MHLRRTHEHQSQDAVVRLSGPENHLRPHQGASPKRRRRTAPREIFDRAERLILRHEKSGTLTLFAHLGRGKRKKICDARAVLDPNTNVTIAAAKRKGAQLRGQAVNGRDFSAELQASRAVPTFADYLRDTHGPWLLATRRRTGQATLDRLTACFDEEFGKDKLDAIDNERLERWSIARQRDGVTVRTVLRDIDDLRKALKRAVEPLKLLDANPIDGFERPKYDKAKRVLRALTADEEQALREALAARDEKAAVDRASGNAWRRERKRDELPSLAGRYCDVLTPAVLTSIETGVRRGELFALTWTDVDLAGKTLHVEGEGTKSYQTRGVELNGPAVAVLRKLWMQLGQPKNGPVFGGTANLKKSFGAVLKAAGIKSTRAGKITWHSLRHTFGSRLGAAGVDAVTLRDLMGHKDISTTNIYLHSDAKRRRAAVDFLVARRSWLRIGDGRIGETHRLTARADGSPMALGVFAPMRGLSSRLRAASSRVFSKDGRTVSRPTFARRYRLMGSAFPEYRRNAWVRRKVWRHFSCTTLRKTSCRYPRCSSTSVRMALCSPALSSSKNWMRRTSS